MSEKIKISKTFIFNMLSFIFKLVSFVLLVFTNVLFMVHLMGYRSYIGVSIHNHQKYGDVEIRRDQFGIPRIKGNKHYESLYFGLGYVHASDRLWSMNLKRYAANGRLSEITGEKGIAVDRFFRSVGLGYISKMNSQNMKKQELTYIQAYTDGINEFVSQLSILPFEFQLTGTQWEEWKIEDSMAIYQLQFLLLSYDFVFQPFRSNFESVYGRQFTLKLSGIGLENLFDTQSFILSDLELGLTNLDSYGQIYLSKQQGLAQMDGDQQIFEANLKKRGQLKQNNELFQFLNRLESTHFAAGSNSWVIHGNHTKSGYPMLANDPHMGNMIPCNWYQVEVLWPDSDTNQKRFWFGATLPGTPFFVIGRNQYVSWGATVLFADVNDLYQQKIIDDQFYEFDGAQIPIKKRKEYIYVKGRQDPIEIELSQTHRGPILETYMDQTSADKPFASLRGPCSLIWPGLSEKEEVNAQNQLLQGFMSKDLNLIFRNLDLISTPSMSIVYASTNNQIGFYGDGDIPIRQRPVEGGFIQDGTVSDDDWVQILDKKKSPAIVNPPKGYIVATNNRISSDQFIFQLFNNQQTNSRAMRANNLIKQKLISKEPKFDTEYMKMMMADTQDQYISLVLPGLVNFISINYKNFFHIFNDTVRDMYRGRKNDSQIWDDFLWALQNLANWNHHHVSEGPQAVRASTYNVFEFLFLEKILHNPEMSQEDRTKLVYHFTFDHFLLQNFETWGKIKSIHLKKDANAFSFDWCQNNITETQFKNEQYPCFINLMVSLLEVQDYLRESSGSSNESQWEWGQIHPQQWPHETFGKIPFLSSIFNLQHQGFGNRRTLSISVTKFAQRKFGSAYGANYRAVFDMAPDGQNYWIIDTGISENLLSKHYSDQHKLHEKFQFIEIKYGHENFNLLSLKENLIYNKNQQN